MSNAGNRGGDGPRDAEGLRLDSFRKGDGHIVVLAGTLDVATCHELEAELERLEATDARLIVIDLRELAFADSSGVRAIVLAHRRCGHRLAIVKGPARVQRVFDVQGMAKLLPFVDDADSGRGTPDAPAP